MELIEILEKYNSEAKCIKYLEDKRWGNTPVCPYCSSIRSSPKGLRHTCIDCKNSFSVKVGTVFQDTRIPLSKWFIAIISILSARKGISSMQLSRLLDVNKNTAWSLQYRIRKEMSENDFLCGIVEVDETYVGGSQSNKHHTERQSFSDDKIITGSYFMEPVLGMVERSGKVVTRILDKACGDNIIPIMQEKIATQSTVVTDGFGGYSKVSNVFDTHKVLNHSKNEFRKGVYHTNTIEGFWSILKRAVIGQFHRITVKHLQSYLDELCFKYNNREKTDFGFANLLNRLLLPINRK